MKFLVKKSVQALLRKTIAIALIGAGVTLGHAPKAHAYDLFNSYLQGQTNQTSIGGTNAIITVVPASTANYYDIPSNAHNTNQFNAIEFVTGQGGGSRLLPIQLSFTSSAANTANTTVWMSSSIDRNNWTTNAFIFSVAGTGTKQTTAITNLDTFGIPYWCVTAISNAAATASVTNLFLGASRVKGI